MRCAARARCNRMRPTPSGRSPTEHDVRGPRLLGPTERVERNRGSSYAVPRGTFRRAPGRPTQPFELGMQKDSTAIQPGAYGPNRASDDGRRLGVAVVMEVTEDDHLAIARRKGEHGAPHLFDRFLLHDVVQYRVCFDRVTTFGLDLYLAVECHKSALAAQSATCHVTRHPIQVRAHQSLRRVVSADLAHERQEHILRYVLGNDVAAAHLQGEPK